MQDELNENPAVEYLPVDWSTYQRGMVHFERHNQQQRMMTEDQSDAHVEQQLQLLLDGGQTAEREVNGGLSQLFLKPVTKGVEESTFGVRRLLAQGCPMHL